MMNEDEREDEAIPEPIPPMMYRNKGKPYKLILIEFTASQLSQLQDILIRDMANSISNAYAFQQANTSLVDIFDNACSQIVNQKQCKN